MSVVEFKPWPKIARLRRNYIITEKIDGTNACIIVTEFGTVHAQSRNRVITPDADNYGFARWVNEHSMQLAQGLGEGYHYGEWWGLGIQRGYAQTHKRREEGSLAAPGFKPCEGIVLYHSASRQNYKVMVDGDDTHKGASC